MKCVVCEKLMKVVKKDESIDSKNKKKYTRIVYKCSKDDVWIGVEVPLK